MIPLGLLHLIRENAKKLEKPLFLIQLRKLRIQKIKRIFVFQGIDRDKGSS